MRREPSDLARILLEKARQDEAAVRVLLDSSDVADEIVAFERAEAYELIRRVRTWAEELVARG